MSATCSSPTVLHSGTGTGYSGSSFDRWVGEQSINQGADNAINKMQHQFWVAKQTILRRIGKKEDDCVVASDAELDAKLELFLSIQETCSNLHKVVEQYQDRLQGINYQLFFIYPLSSQFFFF